MMSYIAKYFIQTKPLVLVDQAEKGNRSRIYLQHMEMETLPPKLANYNHAFYKKLTRLSLQHNSLTCLCSDFGQNLPQLRTLYLDYNRLRTLPSSFSHMDQLRKLNIGHNPLRRLPPVIYKLPNLKELWANSIELREIGGEIGQLVRLRILGLRSNSVDHLPKEFAQLKSLVRISLAGNLFRSIPPEILELPTLVHFSLDDNYVNELPAEINLKEANELRYLRLSNNCIQVDHKTCVKLNRIPKLKWCLLEGNPRESNISQRFKGVYKPPTTRRNDFHKEYNTDEFSPTESSFRSSRNLNANFNSRSFFPLSTPLCQGRVSSSNENGKLRDQSQDAQWEHLRDSSKSRMLNFLSREALNLASQKNYANSQLEIVSSSRGFGTYRGTSKYSAESISPEEFEILPRLTSDDANATFTIPIEVKYVNAKPSDASIHFQNKNHKPECVAETKSLLLKDEDGNRVKLGTTTSCESENKIGNVGKNLASLAKCPVLISCPDLSTALNLSNGKLNRITSTTSDSAEQQKQHWEQKTWNDEENKDTDFKSRDSLISESKIGIASTLAFKEPTASKFISGIEDLIIGIFEEVTFTIQQLQTGEQVQRPDNDLESRNHLVYLEPDSRAKNQSSLNLKKVEQASDKRNKGCFHDPLSDVSQVFSERELLNLEEETRDLNKISTMERVKEWVLSVAISACQKDYPDYQAMVKDHLRAFDSQESSEKCVKVWRYANSLKTLPKETINQQHLQTDYDHCTNSSTHFSIFNSSVPEQTIVNDSYPEDNSEVQEENESLANDEATELNLVDSSELQFSIMSSEIDENFDLASINSNDSDWDNWCLSIDDSNAVLRSCLA